MADPSPEVIRVDPDGTPVYVDPDWDSPQSLTKALEAVSDEAVKAPSRAETEARHWAAEQAEKIRQRLAELEVAHKYAEELMTMSDAALLTGVERWYSAPEAARFFSRSSQWIYDRLKKHKFRYTDGTEIIPIYDGDPDVVRPRARFNLELIREMALSCYRSGTVKYPELQVIFRRVAQAALGEAIFEDEEED